VIVPGASSRNHVATGRFGRSIERFRANPASIENATSAVVLVTVAVVFSGAVVVRAFDRSGYPSYGRARWFTPQTVTTVGCGDVTPEQPIGRIVASGVLLTAIGLLTVATASITSMFIESVRSKLDVSSRSDEEAGLARLESSLVGIAERLDRLELMLTERHPGPDGGTDDAE
jgi:voltage-gated potassium channel Kch